MWHKNWPHNKWRSQWAIFYGSVFFALDLEACSVSLRNNFGIMSQHDLGEQWMEQDGEEDRRKDGNGREWGWRFPEGSGRQGRMERYCCNVICGPDDLQGYGTEMRWDDDLIINAGNSDLWSYIISWKVFMDECPWVNVMQWSWLM